MHNAITPEEYARHQPTWEDDVTRRRFRIMLRPLVGLWPVFALFLVVSVIVFDQIEEDAFIYYRAAQNISNGHGYVFNAAGERIEVGSSIVWQAGLALIAMLPIDLVFTSKVIGIGFGLATIFVVHQLNVILIGNPPLRIFPPLLLAVSAPFYCWSQRGLETPLYTFAITLVAWFAVDQRLKRFWVTGSLLVLTSRPEGFIVLPGLAGFFLVERPNWRANVRGVAVVVAVVAGISLWRLYYFHDVLPSSAYVKGHNLSGLPATAAFVLQTHLWGVLVLSAVGLMSRKAWTPPFIAVASLGMAFLVWALLIGDGFKPYNRHLVPALPLLYVMAVYGLDQLSTGRRWRATLPWATALFAAWLLLVAPGIGAIGRPIPNVFWSESMRIAAEPREFSSSLAAIAAGVPTPARSRDSSMRDAITANWQFNVGEWIAKRYPRGITIAYDQMGQTPWYAGHDKVFIDTLGLTYRRTGIAVFNSATMGSGSPLGKAYTAAANTLLDRMWREDFRRWQLDDAVEHIFALEPEVIMFNRLISEALGTAGETRLRPTTIAGLLAQDPRLPERYVLLDTAVVSRDIPRPQASLLVIYERRDLKAGDEHLSESARD